MTANNADTENLERLGKTISTVFIACLAAFFLYGYASHLLLG